MSLGPVFVAVLLVAVLMWLTGFGRARHEPAPEDDIHTPIDREELAEAERELQAADDSVPLSETSDDDDDWGPGAGGRSSLPGIL